MEADWSVALAADDPVITVPWAAAADEGECRFFDLRVGLDLIDQIAEAQAQAPLRFALLALNRAGSPFWTAKCDVWTNSEEPRDPFEMDAEPGDTAFTTGSYIDLLARDPGTRESFVAQELWLRRVTGRLHEVAAGAARVELVLRRAHVDGQPSFGVSWFVEGCGATADRAEQMWARALSLALAVILESLRTDPC